MCAVPGARAREQDLDIIIRINSGMGGEGSDEVWISDATAGYTGFTLDNTFAFSMFTHVGGGSFGIADLDSDGVRCGSNPRVAGLLPGRLLRHRGPICAGSGRDPPSCATC